MAIRAPDGANKSGRPLPPYPVLRNIWTALHCSHCSHCCHCSHCTHCKIKSDLLTHWLTVSHIELKIWKSPSKSHEGQWKLTNKPEEPNKKHDNAEEEYEDDGFTIMVRESICQPTHCNSKPAERRPWYTHQCFPSVEIFTHYTKTNQLKNVCAG